MRNPFKVNNEDIRATQWLLSQKSTKDASALDFFSKCKQICISSIKWSLCISDTRLTCKKCILMNFKIRKVLKDYYTPLHIPHVFRRRLQSFSDSQKWISLKTFRKFNPFGPSAPFLYPLKASENLTIFLFFQDVEGGCTGSEWIKFCYSRRLL